MTTALLFGFRKRSQLPVKVWRILSGLIRKKITVLAMSRCYSGVKAEGIRPGASSYINNESYIVLLVHCYVNFLFCVWSFNGIFVE